MILQQELGESFVESVNTALSKDSKIGKLIKKSNEEDLENFTAKMKD